MNTAEYLVKRLEELGVNDFFGLPGDYNFDILYAIQNNSKSKWYGCTNELNAGYAADGYARQRGYGAVVTTYGVGELSAINAVAGSYAENVPVVNIVGLPSSKILDNKTLVHHNFSKINTNAYIDSYKNVVETATLLTRDNAKLEIDRVLSVLVKEKRPVYIAIPKDVATMEISDRDFDYDWSSDEEVLNQVVEKINEKIRRSTKPVILADVLIKRYDSKIEFKEFVEKSGIPVTNFMMGTNIIEMENKNYLGSYYANYGNPIAKKWLETTDCLIAVGPIYSDLNSYGLQLPYKIDSQIAIYGTYVYIDGKRYDNVKMSDILEALSQVVDSHYFELNKEHIGYEKSVISEGKLTSEYIYPRLQEFFKENDIIYVDTGVITHGVCEMRLPSNADLNIQALWGSIGWATPASLGACIANPNSRVVLLTGEGSHQISALEVGSMLRYGLKPVVIVLNNKGYSIERMLSDTVEDDFNNIMQMNYSKFARVFEGDIWSTKVETAEDFDKALKVTQIMNKLCYIEVCTDELDLPKLSKEVLTDIQKETRTINHWAKPKKETVETVKLTKIDNSDFGTTVHESLRKEDVDG